jgi:hypothetical protein
LGLLRFIGVSECEHRGSGLNVGEAIQVGAQNVAPENEIHELAFTKDLDQSGSFELFDMM